MLVTRDGKEASGEHTGQDEGFSQWSETQTTARPCEVLQALVEGWDISPKYNRKLLEGFE